MKTRKILLFTVALTLGGCTAGALSGPRYMPRPDISQNNYNQQNHIEDLMDSRSYELYEQREQCQSYRRVPRNYKPQCVKDDIEVMESPVQEIISSYTILFDFDKSDIRDNQVETLKRIVSEIYRYEPKKVTVTGYTDSHGSDDYNQTLSQEREQAVSEALLSRGITNQIIDHEARGEYAQAISTEDGVKNQANRRVVIDFYRQKTIN